MDKTPKKLNINEINANKIFEIKKNLIFSDFKMQNITHKKNSNSAEMLNNKKKNLLNNYNFTEKYVYSVINKTFKKRRTSLLEIDKNFTSEYVLKSLFKKNYLNIKTMRKGLSFNEENRIYYSDNINKFQKNSKIMYQRQKFKTMKEIALPIPLKSKKEYKKDDFDVIALCGKGAYGTVLQVKLKSDPEKYYAIKVIDIQSMKKVNKIYQIYLESQILNELNNPYIVKIFGTFQTMKKVYIVLDYLSKGNFASFLKNNYPLKEDTIKFYSAEIVLFLEYLQSQKVVHRDLKPENIMLNDKYHLTMIDFATVRKMGFYYDKIEMKFRKDDYDLENDNDDIKGTKLIVNPDNDDDDDEEDEDEENDDIDNEQENNINENKIIINNKKNKKIKKVKRNKTFVGTAEYVSPEVLSDQSAGYGADLWAFGIMLYQMYCGQTPFKSNTNYLTFKNIEKLEITYPDKINISKQAKDLINKILVKDPNKRLGAGEPNTNLDIAHLKKHPFFKGIKWKNLVNQNVPNAKNFKLKIYKKAVRNSKDNINKEDNKIEKKEKNEIIKTGILLKKSFWFIYTEYFVILYNTPKIEYRNVDKTEISGRIYLNKKCKIYATKSDIFNLETPHGTYKFKSKFNDLINWINAIKDCIKKYGKEE